MMSNLLLVMPLLLSTEVEAVAKQDPIKRPNIVFLIVESTDGRTWQRGYQNDVVSLPNLRKLEDQGGYSFYEHYTNSPVCCPSRASFWSGRYPHNIPHLHNNMTVDGAWNNYEGLPANYSSKIMDVLEGSAN